MSELTPKQRELLVNVLRLGAGVGKVRGAELVEHLAPVVAGWLSDAEHKGFRDGVREAGRILLNDGGA